MYKYLLALFLLACEPPKPTDPPKFMIFDSEIPMNIEKAPRVWSKSKEIVPGGFDMITKPSIDKGWAVFDSVIKRGSPKWKGAYLIGVRLISRPLDKGFLRVDPHMFYEWGNTEIEDLIGGFGECHEIPGGGLLSTHIDNPNLPTARKDAWITFILPYYLPDNLTVYVQPIAADENGKFIGGPVHALTAGPVVEPAR